MESEQLDLPTAAGVASDASAIGPEEVLGALKRVMASDPFRSSRRSTAFLAFVVTETVAGRGNRLKERTVARYALERGPEFDPRTDAIVRVQAGRVRDSLVRYYQSAGASDRVRILLAPGSYEPTFVRHEPEVPPPRAAEQPSRAGSTEVAVVRFRELEPGTGPFTAVGVCESLVDSLARYAGLRVRGPIDAAVDGTQPTQVIDLGSRTGVSYVVHGSIRTGADEVRVTARMTDVATGRVIWSQTFDRGTDTFSGFLGEDDLVHQIVETIAGLGGVLHREARVADRDDRWGEVFRATTDFHRFVEDSAPESLQSALSALGRALELEPDHPDLMGMLAACQCVGAMLGHLDPGPALDAAEQLARRAVATDGESPRALITLGLVSLARGDRDDARTFAARAAAAWPQRPPTLFSAGVVTLVTGDWDAGISMLRELARTNPTRIGRLHLYLALDALLADDDATALVEANLIPAGPPWGPFLRGLAHAGLGFIEAAARELGEADTTMPGFVSDRRFADPRFWDIAAVAREMLVRRVDALPVTG